MNKVTAPGFGRHGALEMPPRASGRSGHQLLVGGCCSSTSMAR